MATTVRALLKLQVAVLVPIFLSELLIHFDALHKRED